MSKVTGQQLYETLSDGDTREFDTREQSHIFLSVDPGATATWEVKLEQAAVPDVVNNFAANEWVEVATIDETSSVPVIDESIAGGVVRLTVTSAADVDVRAMVHEGISKAMRTALMGEHVASLPSLSDGDTTRAKTDDKGRLIINKGTKDAGELIGPHAQRVRPDSAFHSWNGATLSSGQEITHKMTRKDPDGNDRTPDGARRLSGRIVASTGYGVYARWYDDESFTTQIGTDEEIASGSAGAAETTFDIPARSPHAEIVVDEEAGGGDATVDGVVHLR